MSYDDEPGLDRDGGPMERVPAAAPRRGRRGAGIRARACHLLGMPASVALLIAFVMPWAAVSCNGMELATANGIGVATGQWDSEGDKKPSLSAEAKEDIRVPVELLAVPLAAIALLGLGTAVLIGGARGPKAVPLVVTGLALMAMLAFEGATDFGMDLNKSFQRDLQRKPAASADADSGDPKASMENLGVQMMKAIRIEVKPKAGYWIALGASFVIALGGFLGLVLRDAAPPTRRRVTRRRPISRPSEERGPAKLRERRP